MFDLNHLAYARWCDKGLSELFVCFCEWCGRTAEEEGLDLERVNSYQLSPRTHIIIPISRRSASGVTTPGRLREFVLEI